MRIAVLSGKGGTGKTTVAASLAIALGCNYLDCDVEEPNGALFLHPTIRECIPVHVLVPQIIEEKCDGCGACARACRFNAMAVVKGKVLLFPEICHHCGACEIACPLKAITEVEREIGVIETDGEGRFSQGRLHIGEAITIPIIQKLKKSLRAEETVILDCSPGASCTVVQTIGGCDYCILVTEPTPFGLHDLKIAIALVRKMGLPFGVIVNKAMAEDQSIQQFLRDEKIPLLLEIPFMRKIAEDYSIGILPVQGNEEWKNKFVSLYDRIQEGAVS
jgi:MinD superfamily P-loop ATPase